MLVSCTTCHRQFDVGALPPGGKLRCPCGERVSVPAVRAEAPLRMLHCGTCGGRLEQGATVCGYCEAQVALGDRGLGDLCPECLARMLKDARHCSTCGVAIRPLPPPRLLTRQACPRCEGSLAERAGTHGRQVECLSCGGLWLDRETFAAFREAHAVAGGGDAAERAALRRAASEHSRQQPMRYLPCLQCGQLMNRRQVPEGSGVVVDLCKDHGLWFDGGELEHVRDYLRAGGAAGEDPDAAPGRFSPPERLGTPRPPIPTGLDFFEYLGEALLWSPWDL